ISVSEDFVKLVEDELPSQPWKIGMHHEIIESLNCTTAQYTAAVDILVRNGKVYRQKDGVLYNLDGEIVGVDEERFN
ncbi:hypothetical protein, partial [Yersinia massiliensis]|uniref:hypothetical protein n=1 Tax=Yersinia massiliensis TaxID=419257 RepID=UPI001C982B9D